MKGRLPLFLCLIFLCFFHQGLSQRTVETQTYEKRKFFFAFDTDKSFFNGTSTRFFGFKFGLQFDDKFRVGHGLTVLNSHIPVHVVVNQGAFNEYITEGSVDISMFSSFYERILYLDHRWEFTAALHHGLGSVNRVYIDEDGDEVEQNDGGFMAFWLSLDGHYKVFSWVGVGAGLGYRLTSYKDKEIQKIINSPIYIVKLKLFLGTLYKIAFKGEKPWAEHKKKRRR